MIYVLVLVDLLDATNGPLWVVHSGLFLKKKYLS